VVVLHTQANQDTLKQRILQRRSESDNVSDATLKVLESQISRFERPASPENLIEINTAQRVKIDPLIKRLRTIA